MHVRALLLSLALGASLTPALAPVHAVAQTAAPAPPPCKGMIHVVRVSEIKPGMMETFLKAAASQQAWYKSKGGSDQIIVMRVLDRNQDTKTMTYSETKALTDHVEPAEHKQIPHDAGYDAFVDLYKQSSTISSEFITCGQNM